RKLKPPSKRLCHQKWMSNAFDQNSPDKEMRLAPDNPFLTAFVVPNPVAPKSQVAPPPDKKDEISLRDWNSDESLSAVHKIPGKWTIVVKAYRNPVRLVSMGPQATPTDPSASNGKQGSLMDANRKSAHQLAEILRHPQVGFD